MFKKDLIKREEYIEKVKPYINKNLIKIITGVRRSGKSYLLDMISEELIELGVNKDHIIYKLYTHIEEENIDKTSMYNEIKSLIKDNEKYYLLLDEVQEVEGWEQTVNSLFELNNVDIYVTGSNSKLTNENISSYLSGRYVLIPVYTLSFKEYIKFKNLNDNYDELFLSYLKEGGFPLISSFNLDLINSYQIIEDIYHSIINKDIASNHIIKDIDKFERVVRYVMNNVGKTFSANTISMYLKSQHRELCPETVYNYIKWLKDCFIIYQCNRYDIQGKEILKTQEKYYLSDISLRYALFGLSSTMLDSTLENIVYLELKRRGYQVYIGKLADKEIDFIATKNGETQYIQVCVQLPLSSYREIGNLKAIKDNGKKFILTMKKEDCGFIDGIEIKYIVDYLLNK